jgi:hypothetical protein
MNDSKVPTQLFTPNALSSFQAVQRSTGPQMLDNTINSDEYKNLHDVCMLTAKGKSLLANNYIAVMYALAGADVNINEDTMTKEDIYKTMYGNCAKLVKNNFQMILANSFGIFDNGYGILNLLLNSLPSLVVGSLTRSSRSILPHNVSPKLTVQREN